MQDWLNAIDANPPKVRPEADARLAEYGLQLLTVLGWSLELSKCVRCNKLCPPQASAHVNPRQGGVVCRACGGAGPLLSASLRRNMERAARLGTGELSTEESGVALGIVELALLTHVGIE